MVIPTTLLAVHTALATPQAVDRFLTQKFAAAQPSLGDFAREVKAERAKQHLKDVPLYTNDNLPRSGGISVLGPSASATSQPSSFSPGTNLAIQQKMSYLRGKLGRLQQRLGMHQRELSVLQQQWSQSSMQYYPNPNKTLMQEYSRQDVNKLANEINQKKQQIAAGQQQIQSLQDELDREQSLYGWLSEATPGGAKNGSQAGLPPGITPGTPQYWQACIQAAQRQLASAKEHESLAKNELSLLRLQQLRSLDPNTQANLASSIPAKQAEVASAAQAVRQAQQQIQKLEKEAQTPSPKAR